MDFGRLLEENKGKLPRTIQKTNRNNPITPSCLNKKHLNFGQGLDFLNISEGNRRPNEENRRENDETARTIKEQSMKHIEIQGLICY